MKNIFLFVEDEPSLGLAMKQFFNKQGIECLIAVDGLSALKIYQKHKPLPVVVLDYHLPDMTGAELAQQLKRLRPDQQILFCTGDQSFETMSALLQTGLASGFVPKGNKALGDFTKPIFEALERYKREYSLAEEAQNPNEIQKFLFQYDVISGSKKIYQAFKKAETYRNLSGPVMIAGETGTGKELMAKAFAKKGQKFISINCGQYKPEGNFLESELFGVLKGSYTGADKDRPGIFETIGDGVLFLDEFPRLPLSAQESLLRVLEVGKFRRLGDGHGHEIQARFRLITGVQSDIRSRIETGEFLKDLYSRINVMRVDLIPLRERLEDVEILAEHFRRMFLAAEPSVKKKTFRAATLRLLEQYTWPLNVRELRNAVFRMVADAKSDVIEPTDFIDYLEQESQVASLGPEEATLPALAHEAFMALKETEYFKKILSESSNQLEAAKKAGLPKSTFNNKLKRLGIEPKFLFQTQFRKGVTNGNV